MADPEGQDPGDSGLVFAAHNTHDPRCVRPPRVRNTDNPGLYHGYFENRYGEQFVFTFDRATGTGTVSGGDLGWGDPKPFTLGLLGEALRSTRDLAARVVGSAAGSKLPVIDAAYAGRDGTAPGDDARARVGDTAGAAVGGRIDERRDPDPLRHRAGRRRGVRATPATGL
jgi:hypothetical protein